MKGNIYFFRHCVKPQFVAYDGSLTDSILNAVGYLRESDANDFMVRQAGAVDMCQMPVWEWLARCNEAKDAL